MPGYKTHVVGGALFYIGALFLVATYCIAKPSIAVALEWFFCCIIGSLFPDIDTKSQGQMLFYKIIAIVLLVLLYKKKIALFIWAALLALLPLLVHHRGLFHKIWFIIAFSCASVFFVSHLYPAVYSRLVFDAFFFAIGAFSHIIFDVGGSKFKRLW